MIPYTISLLASDGHGEGVADVFWVGEALISAYHQVSSDILTQT